MAVLDPLYLDGDLFPGFLRLPTPADVLHLVTQHSRTHLGFPPGVAIEFPAFAFPHPRIRPDDKQLRPGDVYLFNVSSLMTHLIGVPGFIPNVVEDFLLALGATASAEVSNVVGLAPLAWTVPPKEHPTMPRPAHVRMTFSGVFGTLAQPHEIWSFGVNAAPGTAVTTDAQMHDAATAMVTAYTNAIKPNMKSSVVLTQALYALVGADGHVQTTAEGAYRQAKVACNVAGNNAGAGYLPLQTALVVSLVTPRAGASGRGRFFLPFQGNADILNDFRLDPTVVTSWAQHAGNFINALNQIDGDCCVVSSKGFLSLVTGVRVGRVPDTMRSRRDRLDEGYIAAPIVAG